MTYSNIIMEKYKGAFIFEDADKILLYNPYFDSIYKINKSNSSETFEKIINKELEDKLIEECIIFEKEFNYNSISKYMINRTVYNENTLTITDALSYSCNLHCVYCMQQNTFKGVGRKTYKEKVDLWEQLLSIYYCDSLNIYLFGGEPFLDIEYLSNMISYAKEKELPINSYSAVTNGTILSDTLIEIINSNPFHSIQITLDGTPKVHNSRRVGNAEDDWNKIVDNMHTLLDKTNVQIIINTVMDANNSSDYLEMVDILINEFKDYIYDTNQRIIFKLGMECHPQYKSEYTIKSIPNEKSYNQLYFDILRGLIEKGVYITGVMTSGVCISKKEKDLLISPDGSIYKCITGLGMDRFKIATYDDAFNNPLKLFVNQAEYLDNSNVKCQNCEYMTLCNGGCRYSAYIENKDMMCRKNYYQEFLPTMLEIQSELIEVGNDIYRKDKQ